MNRFFQWFKDLVLPFENPEHPLYYDPTQEQDNTEVAVRAIFGDDFVDYLFGEPMTTPSAYTIPSTIRPRMSRKEYWARRKQLREAYFGKPMTKQIPLN